MIRDIFAFPHLSPGAYLANPAASAVTSPRYALVFDTRADAEAIVKRLDMAGLAVVRLPEELL